MQGEGGHDEGKGGEEGHPRTRGAVKVKGQEGEVWCRRVKVGMGMSMGMWSWISPPPPLQPFVLRLPEGLQKALGNDFEVGRKAAAARRFAQVLDRCCGPSQQIFSDPNQLHYTLQWVMRRPFRCPIGKNGEGKGEWRKDPAKGGAQS